MYATKKASWNLNFAKSTLVHRYTEPAQTYFTSPFTTIPNRPQSASASSMECVVKITPLSPVVLELIAVLCKEMKK